jgi:hypothetical protein
VEFLLGLSKQERERRIARQRLVRRLFWSLGAVALVIQIGVIAFPSQEAQVASAELSHTPTPEQIPVLVATATAAPTATATPTQLPPPPVPTATIPPSPTLAPTATGTNLVTGRSEAVTSASLDLTSPPPQVTEQSFQLSGTGHPGDTITVTYRRSIIAEGQVDQEGRWQVDIPTTPLARGRSTFNVSASTDNRSVSFTLVFAPWWLDAPSRLQGDLGEGYACAPTVLAMALDYYHHQDNRYTAPETTKIVQALKDRGFVDGYGADAQMLVNLAIEYGYSHSYFFREWSQAHLRRVLDNGAPVIVNVRVNMSADGYGHSVLVIGLSPDGSRVMVNDPTQGMVEYTWDAFDRSWGSFGPPYRHGLVVKP